VTAQVAEIPPYGPSRIGQRRGKRQTEQGWTEAHPCDGTVPRAGVRQATPEHAVDVHPLILHFLRTFAFLVTMKGHGGSNN
jgi:hypothetical protein